MQVPGRCRQTQDGSGGVDGLAGANCIVFSDDGNFAYVTGETDDSISWFS